jgi:hypothetical protein
MAAEGLSDREIGQQLYLSHRTVGTQLYRIFPAGRRRWSYRMMGTHAANWPPGDSCASCAFYGPFPHW